MNEIDILLVNFIYTNKNENKFYNFMHVWYIILISTKNNRIWLLAFV